MKLIKLEELSYPITTPITGSLAEAINSIMESDFTKDDASKSAT